MAFRALHVLILFRLLLYAPAAAADAELRFLIESISVSGTVFSSDRIVVSESRLREGQSYTEPELSGAMSRIHRLPFVLDSEFRLAKGSAPGQYVLLIHIREASPVFIDTSYETQWFAVTSLVLRGPGPAREERSVVDSSAAGVVVGGRWFVGSRGVLHAAAQLEGEDKYSLSYTQHDLFQTRASLALVATYQQRPYVRHAAGSDRVDWSQRDNVTYEMIGVVPLGANQSIRGSWQWRNEYVIYFVPADQGSYQMVIRPAHQDRQELFWIYDTTNDPLFMTRGTRLSAGATRHEGILAVNRKTRTVPALQLRATAEKAWELSPIQSAAVGAGLWHVDDDLVREYRGFARYSADLLRFRRGVDLGDLRLEAEINRTFSRTLAQDRMFASSQARVGLAFRNTWGIARLDFTYTGWREP